METIEKHEHYIQLLLVHYPKHNQIFYQCTTDSNIDLGNQLQIERSGDL